LSQAFARAAPSAANICPLCNGPSPAARGSAILYGHQELRRCETCDRPVGADGKTLVALWPSGEEHFRSIRLMPTPPECPPLPEECLEIERRRRETRTRLRP
jgi:hypothetical protein